VSLAIVMPCYNEAARFDVEAIARLAMRVERLVLVDDGSTDATRAVLAGLAARFDRVEVVSLPRNGGKAEAVRAGLRHAVGGGATTVGYYDADLATPVDELLRLVEVLAERPDVDVLMASRVGLLGHAIERRTSRHYFGRLYATAASLAIGIPVYDTQCGAKLFRVSPAFTAAIERRFPDRWSFDVELLARLLHPDADVEPIGADQFLEVPLRAWCDVDGSKVRVSAGLRAVVALWGVRRRRRRAVRRDGVATGR
jgi:glycosyltransferase involved in cell wall biosynthesis